MLPSRIVRASSSCQQCLLSPLWDAGWSTDESTWAVVTWKINGVWSQKQENTTVVSCFYCPVYLQKRDAQVLVFLTTAPLFWSNLCTPSLVSISSHQSMFCRLVMNFSNKWQSLCSCTDSKLDFRSIRSNFLKVFLLEITFETVHTWPSVAHGDSQL